MNNSNITAKDLNLLVVFEAVFRSGNVSKAAEELSLSQSAVSHSLARLRGMFADPLFTRLPRGIVPTPRAVELAPQITSLIEGMRTLFESPHFSPETAKGRVAVASTEYLEMTLLSPVFAKMRASAPGVVFQFRNASGRLPKVAMERGDIDVAIAGFFGDLPEGFYQQKILEFDFVCVARKKNPGIKGRLSLDQYIALEHLLISPQGDLWGIIDEKLQQQKKSRRVVGGFENYLTPGWYVSQSDLLVTVPRYLGEFYAEILPVQVHELPLNSPRVSVVQTWHERTNASPLHRHVRAAIAESGKAYAKS